MQNELNRKIIIKQRIIVIVSLVATLVLAALLVSQIRLARRRKREAEINAELFHFKQQNKDLAQKHAEHEQIQQDYADRLSEALMKEQRIMLLLDNYLNSIPTLQQPFSRSILIWTRTKRNPTSYRISNSRARRRRITLEPPSIWWIKYAGADGKRWKKVKKTWTFSK